MARPARRKASFASCVSPPFFLVAASSIWFTNCLPSRPSAARRSPRTPSTGSSRRSASAPAYLYRSISTCYGTAAGTSWRTGWKSVPHIGGDAELWVPDEKQAGDGWPPKPVHAPGSPQAASCGGHTVVNNQAPECVAPIGPPPWRTLRDFPGPAPLHRAGLFLGRALPAAGH